MYVKDFSEHGCILQGALFCDSLLSCSELMYMCCVRAPILCRVCALPDWKIQPPFQFFLLVDISNQCDKLSFFFLPTNHNEDPTAFRFILSFRCFQKHPPVSRQTVYQAYFRAVLKCILWHISWYNQFSLLWAAYIEVFLSNRNRGYVRVSQAELFPSMCDGGLSWHSISVM